MGLYSQWRELADQERDAAQHKAFWNEYFDAETKNYKGILAEPGRVREGALSALAEEFGMTPVHFTGFLDGINTSLVQELDLAALEETTSLRLEVDHEALYFNMHKAKANWLYELPEWDPILTDERRAELAKEYRASLQFVRQHTPSRNDPCPCGSGKKYKKCCAHAGRLSPADNH